MSDRLFEKRRRCRPVCLFGTPDPMVLEKQYVETCKQDTDNFQRRWNMNLLTMQPLRHSNGLQWEVQGTDRQVPEGRTQVGMTNKENLSQRREQSVSNSLHGDGMREHQDKEDRQVSEERTQDSDKDVDTSRTSPELPRRREPVRYSPYQKQRRVTDIWRTTKICSAQGNASQLRHQKSQPQPTRTEEEEHNPA